MMMIAKTVISLHTAPVLIEYVLVRMSSTSVVVQVFQLRKNIFIISSSLRMHWWEHLELLVITNDMKSHSRYLLSCPLTMRECFRFLLIANLWKKKKLLHVLHIHTVVLQYFSTIWYMTSWVINITTKMSGTNKNDNNIQMLAGILSPFKDLTPHSLVYFGGLHQNCNKWNSSVNS